jgi:predicted membrane protein
MHADRMSPALPRLFFGLGIVIIGMLFLLDNLNIVDAHMYFHYWPVLLILVGIAYILQSGSLGARVWGGILVFAGFGMLFDRLGYFDFNVWNLWPLVLVFVGGNLVLKSLRRNQASTSTPSASESESVVRGFAVMSGLVRSNASQNFQGGDLSAVMGGIEIDLRHASIKEEAVLDVFAFWGGIEIRIPEDWTVVVKAIPFMGGIDDQTHAPKSETRKRLVITGTAIMGGVEIKN